MLRVKKAELGFVAAKPGALPPDSLPQVAMMGRSNAGKSSLLNKLIGRKKLARVAKAPGRTREINFFRLDDRGYLVDLPGFGYARVPGKVRQAWGKLVGSYLESSGSLNLAVHLVDIRHDPTPLDRMLRDMLIELGIPFVVALTKSDKLSRSAGLQRLSVARKVLDLPQDIEIVATSSVDGTGVPRLVGLIDRALRNDGGRRDENGPCLG